MTVSEFLKLDRKGIERYLNNSGILSSEILDIKLSGWFPKNCKVIKKSHSHKLVSGSAGVNKRGLCDVTFFSYDMKSIVVIIFRTKTGEVTRMCYGDINARGNHLVNIKKEKSFWDYKKKKWRWED